MAPANPHEEKKKKREQQSKKCIPEKETKSHEYGENEREKIYIHARAEKGDKILKLRISNILQSHRSCARTTSA